MASCYDKDAIDVGGGRIVIPVFEGRKGKQSTTLSGSNIGPCVYSPQFGAIEVNRDTLVPDWANSRKGASSVMYKTSTPISPLHSKNLKNRILEIISKEVKPAKLRLSQLDIEKEDHELIGVFIDKLTGPASSTFKSTAAAGNNPSPDNY